VNQGLGPIPEYEIVTKADCHFFPGLRALLQSLRVHARGIQITVLDCGLTRTQRNHCKSSGATVSPVDLSSFRVERWEDQGKFTPAIYAFFQARLYPFRVTVHLDADTVVLGPLDELVSAAYAHGLAAAPDFPGLPLSHQIGAEGALDRVRDLLPHLSDSRTAFNAGVFAIRGDYYRDCMAATVRSLMPLHTRLWGNDQALLNLAAFAANPMLPFCDVGLRFNRRPRYRRAPSAAALEYVDDSDGPALHAAGERVHVLHFVGRPKPWQMEYPQPCTAHRVWKHFFAQSIGAMP
jgi:lipopolysaccharide biosynthesis glycosyltransferase